MPLDIIIGAQWGDEGKGRMVDLLAAEADFVARYNGGDNAGHTVTVGQRTFKLHLIPSGIIRPHTVGVLGQGMVINPGTLLEEIERLEGAGVQISPGRLWISHAAHLITPAHRATDAAQERARGAGQIGTTGRGIGPAYTDRAARSGLRVEALLAEDLSSRVRFHLETASEHLSRLYGEEKLDIEKLTGEYCRFAERLATYVTDVPQLLNRALAQGQRILAEGAQGTLLDLDCGTYPFVTSSHPTAVGALLGLGLGPRTPDRIIGVVKSFQSRVGAGPFPTELSGELAMKLRGTGENPWDEYGTTTGRPRRVGWLDGVLLRQAVHVNTFTELALTKLDVLSGLPNLKICVAYRSQGKVFETLPLGIADLDRFEPVYEEHPGWHQEIRQARHWSDLPAEARKYVRRIEALSGVPIRLISVGPERHQLVEL